jgi:diacylglycerol kinase family enzyme
LTSVMHSGSVMHMMKTAKVYSATAAHVTLRRLGGQVSVHDENTGAKIGWCDVVRGFAHYHGVKGSAHEGFSAVIRGGTDGLVRALAEGIRNGRDDRDK